MEDFNCYVTEGWNETADNELRPGMKAQTAAIAAVGKVVTELYVVAWRVIVTLGGAAPL